MKIPLMLLLLVSGLMTIYAPNLGDYECDATEWHFVINQADPGQMPPYVTVTWDCDGPVQVPLSNISGHTGHYYHHGNLACSLVEVKAQIYQEFDGNFRVSHGPCSPTPTSTPTSTPTATASPTSTDAPTATASPTSTPTDSPTPTPTRTEGPTVTPAATNTPSNTATPAGTPTSTSSVTDTPTPADTPTPTKTPTRIPLPTPEPFVPEASSLLLAASGLSGLATYIGWQIRRRRR